MKWYAICVIGIMACFAVGQAAQNYENSVEFKACLAAHHKPEHDGDVVVCH